MDNSELDPKSSFSSTKTGNHNELKELLESEGWNSDNARNYCLALIHAIRASDVDYVKLLLENGCTVNESGANMFDKPMHHAIEAGNLEIIELLLDARASLLTNSSAKTPLYKVMKNQQFDIVDLMLSKYNIENIDPNNKQEFVHFVIACIRNNEDLVEQFIKKGIDVNGVLDDYADEWAGYTPLYLSVKYSSVEVVEVLLEYHADFTFQDKNGNSPLHLAYYAWKSQNTDTNEMEKASDIMDLILAAHTKNINNFVNEEGLSHFHIACMGRNATLVYYFLQSGVDVNSMVSLDPENSFAKLPLHLAVEHCRTNIVKILLEHEADVNGKNSIGLTSLQIALRNQLYKIAELLLEFKAVTSTEDRECYNAIFQLFSDYPKTGKIIDMMFLAYQENLVNLVDEDGLSLLHVACTRNNIDIIHKLLLTTPDVNACVHKKSSAWAGYSALHFAASVQNLDAIHVLLEHQADVNVVEGRGLTPLWLSLEAQPKYTKIENVIYDKFGNETETTDEDQIIESLLEESENIKVIELLIGSKSNLNYKTNSGEPLLLAACHSFVNCFVNRGPNSEVIISKLCSKYFEMSAAKIMDCLINHGIDINACDSKDNHILHVLAHSASHRQCVCLAIKIAGMVINNGGNVNVSDNTGYTPLHIATLCGSFELVEYFLKFDADVDAANNFQSTPLHAAVTCCSMRGASYLISFAGTSNENIADMAYASNFEKIFDCLLASNCNVNVRDASGQTPFFIAAKNRNVDFMKLLLDQGADINIKDCRNQSPIDVVFSENERFHYDYEYMLDVAVKSLVWHALKLSMIGHPVDPSYLLRCVPVDKERFQFYYRETFICEEEDNDSNVPRKYTAGLRDEVKKLKDTKIDDDNSLFDILGKNLRQVTMHARNKILKEQVCSENLGSRFPNYGYLLELKFRGGADRDAILEKANESLQYVTRTNMPYICMDNIFSYISNKDMNNLVLAAQ